MYSQQKIKIGTDSPPTLRHQNGTLTDVLFNGSIYEDGSGNVLGGDRGPGCYGTKNKSLPNFSKHIAALKLLLHAVSGYESDHSNRHL